MARFFKMLFNLEPSQSVPITEEGQQVKYSPSKSIRKIFPDGWSKPKYEKLAELDAGSEERKNYIEAKNFGKGDGSKFSFKKFTSSKYSQLEETPMWPTANDKD